MSKKPGPVHPAAPTLAWTKLASARISKGKRARVTESPGLPVEATYFTALTMSKISRYVVTLDQGVQINAH